MLLVHLRGALASLECIESICSLMLVMIDGQGASPCHKCVLLFCVRLFQPTRHPADSADVSQNSSSASCSSSVIRLAASVKGHRRTDEIMRGGVMGVLPCSLCIISGDPSRGGLWLLTDKVQVLVTSVFWVIWRGLQDSRSPQGGFVWLLQQGWVAAMVE